MNREQLKELGLTDEQIEAVMKEHGKSINDIKKEADKVDGLESQISDLQGQIKDRDKQLEELGDKAKDNEGLTQEIDRLKEENENATKELQEKLDQQAFDFQLERSLANAGARNPKAVKALLNTENIKLDGERLLGLDDQLKALQESDAYLFEQEQKPGTPTIVAPGNPNGGANTPNPFAKETWNLTEQGKLFKENPDLYNAMKAQAGK